MGTAVNPMLFRKIVLAWSFLMFVFMPCAFAQAPDTVIVTPGGQLIQHPLQLYHDRAGNLTFNQIKEKEFSIIDTIAPPLAGKTVHWARVVLKNETSLEQEKYLYAGDWSNIQVYIKQPTGETTQKQTGQLLPVEQRDVPSARPLIRVRIEPNSSVLLYLRLQGDINLYKPQQFRLQLETSEQVVQTNNTRLLVQGFFMGIIIVMALYNLALYISVRDRSYLYYVLALTGTGLYFMFYHGFALELLWPDAPVWNAHSFAFIVTFNGIFRLLFTRSYLDTRQTMPQWDRLLLFLALLYALPVVMGLLSYFTPLDLLKPCVDLIGLIGGAVLVTMLLVGVLSLKQGYRPALYFLVANVFFVVGALLFILKETQLLPGTALTVYAAQVGMVAQVVLFSLGLAYKLNSVTNKLAAEVVEKERLRFEKEVERKLLVEQQKKELEVTVANRTAALKFKTKELKDTVRQLKASEVKLVRLNQIKDRFFSIISHDLRTPLATLDSFLNILINFSERMKPEQMQKLANHTQLSVRNLQTLLENLLQWAASQTHANDTLPFVPEEVTLIDVIQRNLELLHDTATAKGIRLETAVPVNLKVYSDANMLSFIIRNLLHNAIKFSSADNMVLVDVVVAAGGMVELAVQDQGVGISEDILATLFSQEQLTITAKGTANERGTGLGLLLCQMFAERNGGAIGVTSEIGKGSRFWITIPISQEEVTASVSATEGVVV
jgi:two-component system, sensor histidine kinase LadS